MNTKHLPPLLAVASTAALSAHGQGLEITNIYSFNNSSAGFTAGSSLSSNQSLVVGGTISDLGASAWAAGSYTSAGSSGTTYNQAQGSAWVEGTATGGDDFGRLAITAEYTDFESIWRPATTLWYAQTVENDAVVAGAYKSGVIASSPSTALQAIAGDWITLGIDARDSTYNNDTTGIGNGMTFRVVDAPDVTISGGTASWSVLDNSSSDLDPDAESTLINRNGGPLAFSFSLDDLSTTREKVQGFNTSVYSPFRDDVEVSLVLSLTGENAAGLTDTFVLGSKSSTWTFAEDYNSGVSFDFSLISGTAVFDPTEWADGDFTLSYDLAINQLAYGHEGLYLGSQLLGSLSATQSFTLTTVASAIPEPSSAAVWGGFTALLAGLSRRRRRIA